MLLNFRVSNFLSFYTEEEFSMLAGQVKMPSGHVTPIGSGSGAKEVLRCALVYGANGSGKSNLIKAISFMQKVVTRQNGLGSAMSKYFRLEEGSAAQTSKFELEFVTHNKVYAYGFDLHLQSGRVAAEWLFELKKTTDKPIFERKVNPEGASSYPEKPALRGKFMTRFEVYANDVTADELLLYTLGHKLHEGFEDFNAAFNWISEKLVVIGPDASYTSLHKDLQQPDIKARLCELLEFFNTDITDIDYAAANWEDVTKYLHQAQQRELEAGLANGTSARIDTPEHLFFVKKLEDDTVLAQKVRTLHKGQLVPFEFKEESDGTRRLFDLLPILLAVSLESIPAYTYIIDEIDRSIHPELARKFIEFFLKSTGQPATQLILTTHESSLLDLDLLRRDEVWFVEKRSNGSSHLYSLEEFRPRFDTEIRKAYLQGRYGAIPFISDVEQLSWFKK